MLPMRREKDILIEELPGETLVYDQKRHKVHCLNEAAAVVWRHCDGQTTLAQLAKVVREETNLPKSEEVVQFALSHLAKCQLLTDPPDYRNTEAARWSRRDFARKLGVAAVVVPAVMTIMAPTAAAGSSNICAATAWNGKTGGGSDNCPGLSCPTGTCQHPASPGNCVCV
jgi:hypothetical protein